MKHSYVIIDDNPESVLETKAIADRFQQLRFTASANNYDDGLDLILEHNPALVFLEINPENTSSNLSLQLINELHRYLKAVPKIIVTTKNSDLALEAIKFEVLDYCLKPLAVADLRKGLLRFEKNIQDTPQSFASAYETTGNVAPVTDYPFVTAPEVVTENEKPVINATIVDISLPEDIQTAADTEVIAIEEVSEQEMPLVAEKSKDEKPLIICVKSYGDYRFIEAKDICYLQADNNSTDIHLYNGEMITAFKTLKHFETVLSSPFVRIHNSYIVNIDYVSRIHTGNSVCYIKNTTTKLPFSKSYKENVDSIINSITNGNYLEI